MATVTSLGFNIFSRYDGSGTRSARRDVSDFSTAVDLHGKALANTTAKVVTLTNAMLALGPAIVPVGAAVAASAFSFGAVATAAGVAAGIFGGALKGAITEVTSKTKKASDNLTEQRTVLAGLTPGTKAYADQVKKVTAASKALDTTLSGLRPAQESFARSQIGMKNAWSDFIRATESQTLGPASVVLDAVTRNMSKLIPVVKAVAPVFMTAAKAVAAWLDGPRFQHYIDLVIKYGVPALKTLLAAGRDVVAVLGKGFEAFLPTGQKLVQTLADGAAKLRSWASGGGFERFLATAKDVAPMVKDILKDLVVILDTVAKSMEETSDPALTLAKIFSDLLAKISPEMLTAITYGWIAWKLALEAWAIGAIAAAAANVVLTTAASPFLLLMAGAALTILAVVAALVAVGVGIYFLVKYWDTVWGAIKAAASAVWNFLVGLWNKVWGAIKATALKVWGWLGQRWQEVWDVIKAVAAAVWDALKVAWETVVGALSKAWSAAWDAIKSAASTVWGWLTSAWKAVSDVFMAVWNAFIGPIKEAWGKIWPEMKLAAENVWNALKAAWNAVWGAVTAAWDAFWSVFGPVFAACWDGISAAARAVWTGLSAAWDFLWSGIKSIFQEVVSVVTGIWNELWSKFKATFELARTVLLAAWNFLWAVITATAKAVWAVLLAAWNVLWEVFKGIWNVFVAVFTAIFSSVWNVIVTVATGIWNTLKAAWDALWKIITAIFLTLFAIFTGHWGKAWDAIKAAAQAVWNALKTAFQAAVNFFVSIFNGFVTVFSDGWNAFWESVKKVAGAVWNFLKTALGAFLTAVKEIWNAAWNAVKDVFKGILDWIIEFAGRYWEAIKLIFNTSLKFVKDLWNNVWGAVRDFFKEIIGWIIDFVKWYWEGIKLTFSMGLKFLKDLWNSVWGAIKDFVHGVLDTVHDLADRFWKGLQILFNAGKDFLLNNFWNPVSNFFTKTIPNAFESAVKALGVAWDKLKQAVRAPIQAVVDVVYNGGIVKLWNLVAGVFHAPELSKFTLPKFARGGPVQGPGSGTSDSIAVRLSAGEHVWTAKEVQGAGGHEAVAAMRRNAMGGQQVRTYGTGKTFDEGGGILGTGWGPDFGPDLVPDGILGNALGTLKDLALGAISGPFNAAVDLMANGAKKVIRAIVPGDGSPMEKLATGIPDKIAAIAKSWVSAHDIAPDVGGGSAAAGLAWAKTQAGKPYQWGGNGNPSWDCSGFMSAIESVIRGEKPHRRWATGAFSGGTAPPGWKLKDKAPFMIGVTNAGVGHTAGTLNGTNVESRGGSGCVVGYGARGYNDGMFTSWYGLGPSKDVGGGAASGTSAAAAQATAKSFLSAYGWGTDQWSGLQALWQRESGWNYKASNPSSGAYGIPQALPGSKMASSGKDWKSNPATQIKWGLGYIKGRYKTPNAANAFQRANNWYGDGTRSAQPGWAVVGDQGPELMRMRGGEDIRSNRESLAMVGSGGGDHFDITVPVTIQGNATPATVDKLTRELPAKLQMALAQGVGRRP